MSTKKQAVFHTLFAVVMFACASMICHAAFAVDASSWKRFSSNDGRFSILMPATPTLMRSVCDTPIGAIDENRFIFENGYLELAVEYTDLPGLAVIFGGRGKIYRNSVEAFLEDVGGRKLKNHTFTLDAYEGKEISYETDTHVGKARFLLIGNRLYVLHAAVTKSHRGDGIIEYYLESFEPIYRDHRRRRS